METGYRKKPKIQIILSVLTVGIGILLMVMKIYADSEPGAIPLLLILVGTGWYFITRSRNQRQV